MRPTKSPNQLPSNCKCKIRNLLHLFIPATCPTFSHPQSHTSSPRIKPPCYSSFHPSAPLTPPSPALHSNTSTPLPSLPPPAPQQYTYKSHKPPNHTHPHYPPSLHSSPYTSIDPPFLSPAPLHTPRNSFSQDHCHSQPQSPTNSHVCALSIPVSHYPLQYAHQPHSRCGTPSTSA